MTVVDAVRGWRRDHAAEVLASSPRLVALDNVTGDVPALRRNAERDPEPAARPRRRGRVGRAGRRRATGDRPRAGPAGRAAPRAVRALRRPAGDAGGLDDAAVRADPGRPGRRDRAAARARRAVDDEWRLRARAAADDKAPIVALLAALDALGAGRRRGSSSCSASRARRKSGSPHLGAAPATYADRLAADAWLICDGPVHQSSRQQVVLGVRGFTDLELTVYGPARELHSGHYGNWAPNPALELARLLACMRTTPAGSRSPASTPTRAADRRPSRRALDAMPAVDDELLRPARPGRDRGAGQPAAGAAHAPLAERPRHAGGRRRRAALERHPRRATASIDIRLVPDQTRSGCARWSASTSASRATSCCDRSRPRRRGWRTRIARSSGVGLPGARARRWTCPSSATADRGLGDGAARRPSSLPTLGGTVPLYLFERCSASRR